ncbi:MAG TPA: LysM peptidoglycan-binding domain-containing protein [Bacillota bacterium]|nr:LysM peptidoglycan-binding domain-containing protein [Bacillota bacterium]
MSTLIGKNVELEYQTDSRIVPIRIENVIELPSGRPEIGKVVGYRSSSFGMKAEAEQGKYLIEGGINLVVLYSAADEERFPGLYSVSMEGPVSGVAWGESIEAADVDDGMSIDISGDIYRVNVERADGHSLKVSADALVKLTASESRILSAISDWAEVPTVLTTPRPSMVFYLTQPGDTLWKVARKYQTTMEALARENHLTIEDELPINKRLIIPTVSSGKVTVLR